MITKKKYKQQILPIELTVLLCDLNEIPESVIDEFIPDDIDLIDYAGLTCYKMGCNPLEFLVWINTDGHLGFRTIVHESTHVAMRLLENYNIDTEQSPELLPEFMEWISLCVLDCYNKHYKYDKYETKKSKQDKPYKKTTLGDQIKHELEFHNLTTSDLANVLVMSEDDAIKLVNNEMALTEKIAERLSLKFKIPSEMWYKFEGATE